MGFAEAWLAWANDDSSRPGQSNRNTPSSLNWYVYSSSSFSRFNIRSISAFARLNVADNASPSSEDFN